jgi:AAA15 family ATPase/GTPase
MLLNFKVKNFRSIKDEVILDLQATKDKTSEEQAVFEVGKIAFLKSAAIYGPNASGKSNILKAFMAFRRMVLESMLRSNMNIDLPNEYFKLNSETENKPSFFEMKFLIDNKVYLYGFEINKEKVCAEWLKQEKGNKKLFVRTEQEIKSNRNYFQEATAAVKKQTAERVLFLSVLAANNGELSNRIVKFIQKMNFISGTQRGNTLNFSFGQFLNNPKMSERIKEFILKADFGIVDIRASQKMVSTEQIKSIPDKFKEILFKEDSKIAERNLKFLHKKYNVNEKEIRSEPLDFFAEESDGTQQMFALSAPFIDTLENGKVLFVDEIGSSLHPFLCQYLISLFNSKEKNTKNAQLIFTTHDVSLLKEELLRRDQIYFTEKNKKGATELFSLSDISERKGVDFAKRYFEGRYNALPYIIDFENLRFYK